MSGKNMTLLAILAFVAIGVGSFIWFIANWDASHEEPLGVRSPAVEERRA